MIKSRQLFHSGPQPAPWLETAGLLEKLTAGQHAVLGSPGSGKTAALVALVGKLEAQGANPAQILVLTPTRLGANRLRDEIGLQSTKASDAPRARSVSAFAFAALKKARPDLRLLSGSAQQRIIENLIDQSPNAPWDFDTKTIRLQGFVQELRDLITVALETNLSEPALSEIVARHPSKSLAILQELLPLYRAEVHASGALDPSQLITEAPRSTVAEWVIVDDAQDLSVAALALVAEISTEKNLVLFGDPDSSVLGFRSSGPDGFLGAFPTAQKHYLEPKLAFAQELSRLSSKLPTKLAGPQRPKPTAATGVSAQLFLNQIAEADFVATQIRRIRMEQNLSFSDFAVVARTRTQLEQIAAQLSSRNVPVHIVGAQLALRDQHLARSILELAQLAFSKPEPELVLRVLDSSMVGLDAISIRRLVRQLAALEEFEGLSSNALLLAAIDSQIEPTSYELRKLFSLVALLAEVRQLRTSSAHELVSQIFKAIDSKWLGETARGASEPALAANRDLDSALELFAAAQRFDQNQLGNAESFVKQQLEQAVPEDSLAPIGLRDAVQLTTAAALIDQSYHWIFIPRLQEGIWPNLRPRSSLLGAQSFAAFLAGKIESPTAPTKSELEDEIRQFYKAIGAATSGVKLSAMTSFEEQPSQFFDLLRLDPKLLDDPVTFDLRRLVGQYRRQLNEGDQSVAPRLAALALLGIPGAHPQSWQGLLPISSEDPITEPGQPIRFSPSRLEAFETCPVHWFIQNFGGDGSDFEASVGTLLHAALELSQNPNDIKTYVETNWHTLEFEAEWLANAQRRKALKMAAALGEYLIDADPLLAAEQKFELNLPGLKIVGKIDRLETDGENGVRVVDLKTGRVPTQAQVDSHRQLAVYQLAVRQIGHKVAGARIVSVGDQKLKVIDQPTLDEDKESDLNQLLANVARGAGGNRFVANYSEHCSGAGNCQLLISKVVTGG